MILNNYLGIPVLLGKYSMFHSFPIFLFFCRTLAWSVRRILLAGSMRLAGSWMCNTVEYYLEKSGYHLTLCSWNLP